jgi:hypothetical protein
MASFAGWKMWGNLALVCHIQGLDLLLNVFFGPIVNAARSTAYYVQAAVGNFASNFQFAINPQIMKTYASGQINETHLLIFRATRLTYCLLLILCLPLIVETPTVLGLWLKEVPEGSVTFLRLLLVILMVQQSSSALVTALAATGNIKRFESILGVIMISILPISYVTLKMGGSPWSVFVVYLIITIIAFFVTLYIALPMLDLSLKIYIRYAVKPCVIVLFPSLIAPITIKLLSEPSLFISVMNIVLTVICTILLCFVFGLETEEKREVMIRIIKTLTKMKIKKNDYPYSSASDDKSFVAQ